MGIAKLISKAVAKKAARAATKKAAKQGAKAVGKHALKAALGKDALKLSAKAVASKGRIAEVAFTDAYKATIKANDRIARKSAKNLDKGLLKLIDGSKKSLDGAFYDIEEIAVARRLIAAKRRGVKIRLVTDTDNLVDKVVKSKPREAIRRLKAAKIKIVPDRRSAIMHNKFLVVDGKTVWTGSANLTPRSLYNHNNNALTIKSKEVASQFGNEFRRLFEMRQFGQRARGVVAPNPPVRLRNGTVNAYFSPDGGAREAVLAELKGARKDIKFLTFSLTDKDMGRALEAKAHKGVKVEGVFDRWLSAGKASLKSKLERAGLRIRNDGNEALMHHKVMIIDRKTVITGSFNFSANAERNNEAMLIIKNSPGTARAYAQEFLRVQEAARKNRPPAFKLRDMELRALKVR
jgi:phosphatidylserine/phosphatidylglycerophosphate/cardiolipin synthase-like enzyme